MPPHPGTLFVVATPIGNLEDLTFRALRTLREVDLIAAEDTRRTAKLLAHYEIQKSLVSVREHNEAREATRLVAKLVAGQNIALVSDAGTPGIADPGARLVRAVRERGLTVVPIPGASAVAAALSVSGLEGDQFVFMGFPPSGGTARRVWLEQLAADARIVVCFEAPHRIARTVSDLESIMVKRQILIHRELTKINEEYTERPNTSAVRQLNERGEFTIVIGAAPAREPNPHLNRRAIEMFGRLTDCTEPDAKFDEDESIHITARFFDLQDREVAKIIKKHKILAKQSKNQIA